MFGYDWKGWSVLFYVFSGFFAAFQTMDPAAYGISPVTAKWLVLVTGACMAITGKLGQSWAGKSSNGQAVDLTKVGKAILILGLVGSTVSCALQAKPRTQAITYATGISNAIADVRDLEKDNQALLGLTPTQHEAFKAAWVKVMTIAIRVDQTILAWPKTTPSTTPTGLKPLILELKADLDTALALLPDSATKATIQSKLAAVWSLIGLILGGA